MRIEVAENSDQGRGGNRGGPRDRGPNEPDRTLGDWRSGPRSDADPPPDRDGKLVVLLIFYNLQHYCVLFFLIDINFKTSMFLLEKIYWV